LISGNTLFFDGPQQTLYK